MRANTLLCFFLIALVAFAGCATSGNLSARNERRLQGRTYVIVGASSGIGRGMAEKLGSYKANVVLAARRTDLLEEVARNIRAAGGTALVVTADISKPEDMERLMAEALRAYGTVDVWVNNAGVGAIGPFWDIPLEDQMRVVDVNYRGLVSASYVAIRQFRKQGYGLLMNTGSTESEVPLAYHATYAGTKAAIRNFGNALNQELRLAGYKRKIWVVTIMPWATDTPFWNHASNHSGHPGRMAALDMPGKVVNAMVWGSLHRKREIATGWKAKGAKTSHAIAPRLTEKVSANIMHKWQIKNGPPLAPTSGAVHQPMETGRRVDDSVKVKIKMGVQ